MHGLDSNTSELQQQRIALLLEYYGPAFAGSQVQPNAFTVQQALQEGLARLNIRHRPLCFSGRTDSGVHAKGQVVHFDVTPGVLDQVPDLVAALNAVLPQAMSVRQSVVLEETQFHAQRSAQWRWYQYRVYNAPYRSVWQQPEAAWFRFALDEAAMQAGAQCFVGEHDFESFKCPQTDIQNSVCHVIHSQITREGDYIVYDVVANRFVYKMVRNLMGLLLNIGAQQGFTPDEIPTILARKDRSSAGVTASPEGLSLMAVRYPKPWDFFENNVYGTRLNRIIQESSSHAKNLLRKAS